MATKLTDRASIPAILAEMTVEEKLTLLTGSTTFRAGKNDEHEIPAPLFLDGGTGFNTMQMNLEAMYQAYEEVFGKLDPETLDTPMGGFGTAMGALPSDPEKMTEEHKRVMQRIPQILDETRPADGAVGCYPPGMFFGATMNPDVTYQCGEALGREASACHVDVLLGTPNVNIHRDPRNGRLFEGYSEDPCLVSKLAPSFVKGIQDTGVVANVKHYAANNLETDRMGVNETVSERALREIYLPGFKACVDAGCKTVMSAYNSINGVPCAQNPWLLRKVLREDWGFDGFVMTDWGAAYDRVDAQNAGNDVCMPGPRKIGDMLKAYEEGKLTLEVIDEACTNYLNILLEMPIIAGRKYTQIDTERSMAAAYAAAKEGITLLKNASDVLPLSKAAGVAFYGPRSKKFVECGAGSAEVATPLSTSMYDATVEKIGAEKVSYEQITAETDYVVVTIGANGQEGADRPDMEMEPEDRPILEKAIEEAKAAKKPIILVLNVAAPIDIAEYVDDVDAVLCVYLPGMGGGQAAADILFGDVNPSGKLPLTFPRHYCDTPSYGNFPGEYLSVNYGEGIYVGYRWYDSRNIEPLYPFGHGLSYTRFALSNLKVPAIVDFEKGEKVEISVDIKNIGRREGAEVVQIYISDVESTLDKPVKELKELKKVFLKPGEKQTLTFQLDAQALASWDVKLQSWTTEPGEYRVLVGTSSRNIAEEATVDVKCYNPYGLGASAEVAKIAADPLAMDILKKHLPDVNVFDVIKAVLVFLPRTPFSSFWSTKLSAYVDPANADAVYSAIIADFDAANRSGAKLSGRANMLDSLH